MNTADITCGQLTERTKTINNQHSDLNAELEVLAEVRDKCCCNWYNRVYLCYEDTNFEKPTTYLPINGFNCYRFSSVEYADYGWNNFRKNEKKIEVRHTMIPICKWVPPIFDKYILDWKLKNMYWLGKHNHYFNNDKLKK
jgi:hypothetical protein